MEQCLMCICPCQLSFSVYEILLSLEIIWCKEWSARKSGISFMTKWKPVLIIHKFNSLVCSLKANCCCTHKMNNAKNVLKLLVVLNRIYVLSCWYSSYIECETRWSHILLCMFRFALSVLRPVYSPVLFSPY